MVAAAANGEEDNNVLFNDPDGVLAGALRAASARAPVARSALAARTRAWTYYLLLEPVLKPVAQRRQVSVGPVVVLVVALVDGKNVAEGARALVRRGSRRRGRQRGRDAAIRPRGRRWPRGRARGLITCCWSPC